MNDIKEMLFQMQRFQILTLFTNPQTERKVSPSYAFAWAEGVYPLLNETASWHKPYADMFSVRKEQLGELYALLENRCNAKEFLTFYELEDHYGIRGSTLPGPVWNRADLLKACHYFYLHPHFDTPFWATLLENGKCPSEAHSISREFTMNQVYFEYE